MNRNVSKPISRRGVLFSALGVCALAAGPKRSYALGNGESDNFMDVDLSSPASGVCSMTARLPETGRTNKIAC